MNDVINVLVYANDEFEAQCWAREVVHKKIDHSERGSSYVYYIDFFIDALGLYGKGHRKNIPEILQVPTTLFPSKDRRGLDLVHSVIESNRMAFKQSMAQIRYYISKYTDDQLFDAVRESEEICSDNPSLFRIYSSNASGYEWTDAQLYDFRGNGIRTPEQLYPLLNPSLSTMCYRDYGEPDWGEHIWTKPLWAVPFLRVSEVYI